MRPAFRTGPLIADSYLLEVIPRPVMIRALVDHATRQPGRDGQHMLSFHSHDDLQFAIETPSTRDRTFMILL